VHRLLLRPLSPLIAGRYRQTQVFLADPTGSTVGSMECPPWDQVPELVEVLTGDWRGGHAARADDPEKAVADMAGFFHRLLQIHPFTDGNGRLALELLSLQARELLGFEGDLLLTRSPAYYAALRRADVGDPEPLGDLVSRAVGRL
jgi:fido (protein-threonine AMPylation protein)